MQKIPTLFVRDQQTHKVIDQVTPGCEWVLADEGIATRKYDGTCVMLDENGKWWARREIKPGKEEPVNYVLVDTDQTTGTKIGWVPIADGAHHSAFSSIPAGMRPTEPGTYELCGVKVNGNPENIDSAIGHTLFSHARANLIIMGGEDFTSIQRLTFELMEIFSIEGIVWHHPDGRMAKIKALDFERPTPENHFAESHEQEVTG